MNTVAFIGVGAMGAPIATRVRKAGFEVLLYDADVGRSAEVAAAIGATVATTLADLSGADLIVCLLPNSSVVEQVMLGEYGLFAALPRGAHILDMGSSDPRRTIELAQVADGAGVGLSDAPVSGGVARARTGELTVMFGGREAELSHARPVLDAVGTSVIRVGDVGAGHAMKALNNLLSATGLASALEVLGIGRSFGISPTTMIDVLNRSTGRNNATETKIGQYVLSGTFASGFALQLMLKDISTALDLAQDLGIDIPIGEACVALWRAAASELPADADQTSIASFIASHQRLAIEARI
jgi:3-hydroxyisobutyrate dehydrogenase